MQMKGRKSQSIMQLFAVIIILISVNILAGYFFFRIDMTGEKRYSLSSSSKKMAAELDDVVTIRIYLDGDLPPGFRRLRNATREILDEFRVYAGDNIEYEFIDPAAGKDEKERLELYKQLATKGLFPTNLEQREKGGTTEKIIFPGAILNYRSKEIPVQLLKSRIGSSPEEMLNNSVEGLEYEFTSSFRKLMSRSAAKVAFIKGHGELDNNRITDAARALAEYYIVDTVTINERLRALDDYKAVIIAKPDTFFSEKDKFIIDQFIMNGGRVLWLIDKLAVDMDSLSATATTVALPGMINLDDMLYRYGARINDDLVLDMQSAAIPVVTGYTGNTPKQELFPWPYFPLLNPFGNHPVVNNLNVIRSEFCNSVDTIQVPGVRKTILLTSSDFSKLQLPPARVSLNMLREEPDASVYKKKQIPVAVLLEGTFSSNYRNRIPVVIQQSSSIGFRDSSKNTRMIIIGDGDIISNYVSKKGAIYPLGFDRFTQQSFGNRNFILNCIDYLCDDSGIIELRGKEIKLRMLDPAKLQENSWIRWFNVAVPAFAVLISGWVYLLIRKKRYQKASPANKRR